MIKYEVRTEKLEIKNSNWESWSEEDILKYYDNMDCTGLCIIDEEEFDTEEKAREYFNNYKCRTGDNKCQRLIYPEVCVLFKVYEDEDFICDGADDLEIKASYFVAE